MRKKYLLFLAAVIACMPAKSMPGTETVDSGQDSISHYQRNVALVLSTEGVLVGGIMTSLYKSWYSGSETGGFHLYNDNKEWLQMDKAGHANSWYRGI